MEQIPIGIGLRHPHYQQVMRDILPVSLLELHSENFFMQGGPGHDFIENLAQRYPLSFHGIGLSLGSARGIDEHHLARLKYLFSISNPILISEHLSWSSAKDKFLPDLIPCPYTEEALTVFANNICKAQNFIKQQLLIENPSTYLEYNLSTYQEHDFLIELCKRTGAKILLDINNIFVSCCNHNRSAIEYINSIPTELVGEIHLAGHSIQQIDDNHVLRIDTHNNSVSDEVWELYEIFVKRTPLELMKKIPTIIEWDADIPGLEILLSEANKALQYHKKGVCYDNA
jgi:uncharacterized protein (UPF0276 family)